VSSCGFRTPPWRMLWRKNHVMLLMRIVAVALKAEHFRGKTIHVMLCSCYVAVCKSYKGLREVSVLALWMGQGGWVGWDIHHAECINLCVFCPAHDGVVFMSCTAHSASWCRPRTHSRRGQPAFPRGSGWKVITTCGSCCMSVQLGCFQGSCNPRSCMKCQLCRRLVTDSTTHSV